MHPMAKIVNGRITLECPGTFTFDSIKDMHTRALMVGVPTDASITHIAWHVREPGAPQQVSVYFLVEPEASFTRTAEPPPAPPIEPPPYSGPQTGHLFPNPLTTQE